MATLEEQKEYIRTNYKKLTGQFMAKMLGIPPMIKQKADMGKNPTPIVPNGNDEGKIPLRIDCRTVILIPYTADPEKYRKDFLQKINRKHSSQIDSL